MMRGSVRLDGVGVVPRADCPAPPSASGARARMP